MTHSVPVSLQLTWPCQHPCRWCTMLQECALHYQCWPCNLSCAGRTCRLNLSGLYIRLVH